MHHPDDLIRIFNSCFQSTHQTILAYGDDEPLYMPADEHREHHTIYFAHRFFSSALHECAHWLIAGKERRKQVDYGYWYVPDGRTVEQQELFQSVEVKPQALEWILSNAANYKFQFSIDNLNGAPFDLDEFKKAVYNQVLVYEKDGLPPRASLFQQALFRY